jgi:LmbE family N-acetylglucosaminyl deacetylase
MDFQGSVIQESMIRELLSPPDLFQCRSILCIQPHPDDNEVGAGAIIAKLASKGCRVSYLTVTNGNLGSDDPTLSREEIAEIRNRELQNAGRHLGVSSFYSLDYNDGSLENVTELARDICGIIRTVKPQAVICPDPWLTYEAHSDHRVTGLAASKAVISSGSVHYKTKNNEEPCVIDAVGYYFTSSPNTIVDVTDFMGQKFEAMAMHESQMGGGTFEMFQVYFSMRAAELGKEKGFQAGEGLKVLRPIHLHCFVEANRI